MKGESKMTKRRENKSVEEIAKTKTMIAEIVIGLSFLYVNTMIAIVSNGIIPIISTIVYFTLYIIISILIYKEYMRQETMKYNERVCKNKLSKKRYTKVIPKYKTQFTDGSQNNKSVQFYAKLIEKGKLIVVEVVAIVEYPEETKRINYDAYLPCYFEDYYEIIKN